MRDSAFYAESWQSILDSAIFCHIERSEISQILPLPCGGGLRGWVKSKIIRHCEAV
ncbi:hypothetical protein ACWIUD_00470 [Helicobacter sp. 23-1044]